MLTSLQRKALKAKAHKLEPVVQIGAKGLTEELIAEIDRALKALNLKVRDDARVDAALVGVGDGLTLARRRA